MTALTLIFVVPWEDGGVVGAELLSVEDMVEVQRYQILLHNRRVNTNLNFGVAYIMIFCDRTGKRDAR